MSRYLCALMVVCCLIGCSGSRNGVRFREFSNRKEPSLTGDLGKEHDRRVMDEDMLNHTLPDSIH